MELRSTAGGEGAGVWPTSMDAPRKALQDREGKDNWLLDYVLSRCVVDDETGCWRWTGCIHGRSGRAQMRRHGQSVFVDTEAWRATHGPIRRGLIVVRTDNCDCADCCNPTHRRTMSRRVYAQLLVRSGRASAGARHRLATCRGNRRRKRNKLSLRLARRMRRLAANGSSRQELARLFGVDVSMVGRVLRNKSWADASPWDVVMPPQHSRARFRSRPVAVANERRFRIAA